jgi:hypothetical protein
MDISLGRVVAQRTAGHDASSAARVIATVATALAGRPIDGAVLARCDRRARLLEIVCVGGEEIVAAIAPIAAGFAAEVIVEHVPASDVRAGRAALRRGFVVVAGSLRAGAAARVAHAPA